jgi:Tol biopolymer transport system component
MGDLSSPLIVFSGIPGPGNNEDGLSCDNKGDSELFAVEPDGHGFRRITNTRMEENHPSWSPNRTRIVFAAGPRDSFDRDLYVMRADGTHRRRLTETSAREFSPHWSPAGRRILFLRSYPQDPEGSSSSDEVSLMLVRPDGTHVRRLTDPRVDSYLSADWAPDSKRIVLTTQLTDDRGDKEMVVMRIQDGRRRVVFKSHDQIRFPSWSSKDTIAYNWIRYGEPHIWSVHVDGRRNRKLTRTGAQGPAWARSGRRMAFVGGRYHCTHHVYRMKADGTHRVDLLKGRDVEVGTVDW